MTTIAYIKYHDKQQLTKYKKQISDNYKIDQFLCEAYSLRNTERRELTRLVNTISIGDTIIIVELNQISSTIVELIAQIEFLKEKQIHLISLKEGIDTKHKESTRLIKMIYHLHGFEKENLIDLQKIGIRRAKGEKKYKGRQPKDFRDFDGFERYYFDYKYNRITKKQMAENLGVSRPTLDKLINQKNSSFY